MPLARSQAWRIKGWCVILAKQRHKLLIIINLEGEK